MKILIFLFAVVPFVLSTYGGSTCPIILNPSSGILSKAVQFLEHGAKSLWDFFLGNGKLNDCVFYALFTRKNRETPEAIINVTQLRESRFDPTKLNIFLIHGWGGDYNVPHFSAVKNAALNNHDVNYFAVDWSSASKDKYGFARDKVKYIGGKIGDFINEMQHVYNLNGSSFLLVGHSLGAHVAGNAGAVVYNQLDRIVALDAALTEFPPNAKDRLTPAHAKYVEAIHTDGGKFGILEPIGHVDYYPNGGIAQKLCPDFSFLLDACYHHMSVAYLAESFGDGPIFEGTKCDSYENFLRGLCKNHTKSAMGQLIKDKKVSGKFYLETGKIQPYAVIDEETKNEPIGEKLKNYASQRAHIWNFLNAYMGNMKYLRDLTKNN